MCCTCANVRASVFLSPDLSRDVTDDVSLVFMFAIISARDDEDADDDDCFLLLSRPGDGRQGIVFSLVGLSVR